MSSFEKLKDLDLSREEIDRLGEAFKKEEFRKLLVNYVEEIQNPENQKLYQSEIIELEKERGFNATFINPKPGYVIKSIINGDQKCFINICVNDNIDRPSSISGAKNGEKGLMWSLPHTLSPPREDLDNKGKRCQVYDVVFHPHTLQLAHSNKPFYEMLNNTALDAVEKNFNVILDKNNIKFPKLNYKGLPHASIIKKPIDNFTPPERTEEEKEFFDKIFSQMDNKPKQQQPQQQKKKKTKTASTSTYTTPKFLIKHRTNVDMQEFTESKDAKIHAAIPKELIVEIDLPLIKSSSDITLDVSEKTVQLISEKPSKYKLNLTLPYKVNQEQGNAKFDKDLKKLIITLPVRRLSVDFNQDSGFDSDHGITSHESDEEVCQKDLSSNSSNNNINNSGSKSNNIPSEAPRTSEFLDESVTYTLPEFTSHVFDKSIVFTLNVKNVDESSLEKLINSKSVHLKFISVSSSYYSTHYAFYSKFDDELVEEPTVEIWDNNVVIQTVLQECPKSYWYGIDENNLDIKHFEEDIIQTAIPEEEELQQTKSKKEEIKKQKKNQVHYDEDDDDDDDDDNDDDEQQLAKKTSAINIATSYESSGDELSCSYSPSKGRGILKRMSANRYFAGRSVSESSLDDMVCSSSFDFDADSHQIIFENGENEISSSLKKTVRFNDVIMRQLYRSNSSILGQKKKNQRKARNKKRAQERRHSESEVSEVDDKKEETASENNNNEKKASDGKSTGEEASDIFHMDMI